MVYDGRHRGAFRSAGTWIVTPFFVVTCGETQLRFPRHFPFRRVSLIAAARHGSAAAE